MSTPLFEGLLGEKGSGSGSPSPHARRGLPPSVILLIPRNILRYDSPY